MGGVAAIVPAPENCSVAPIQKQIFRFRLRDNAAALFDQDHRPVGLRGFADSCVKNDRVPSRSKRSTALRLAQV